MGGRSAEPAEGGGRGGGAASGGPLRGVRRAPSLREPVPSCPCLLLPKANASPFSVTTRECILPPAAQTALWPCVRGRGAPERGLKRAVERSARSEGRFSQREAAP